MQTELITKRTSCRVCKGKNLKKILSLGSTPPANAYVAKEDLGKPEHLFPLELYFCTDCSFVQLLDIVSPELLFRNYVYVSSTSPSFVAHFKSLAEEVCTRFGFEKNSLIVDIGSNDGILLKHFKALGMKVLGVDPAIKIAEQATKDGIETIPAFFAQDTAKKILAERGHAKLITATSVFPHIDDLDSLVTAVKGLLADDGIFVIEAYYLANLLEKNLFDTIYHEHLSYFSVKTITDLLERLGMGVFAVEKVNTHGGSIRVFAQKAGSKYPRNYSVQRFLLDEAGKNLDKESTYADFAEKIENNKAALQTILRELKAQGKRIVGYGAAAKANTLLNYFGIGPDILDYIVDDSPWKQGLHAPGTKIPIVSAEELKTKKPDYILLLAWNFAEQIMKTHYASGAFIIPVPTPHIIENIVDQDIYAIANSLIKEAPLLAGKTLLITGGSGFLGSYIVATINYLNKNTLKKPCKVISIDNHIVGSKNNNLLKEIKDENIVFREHDVCLPIVIEEQIDYIINAAGVASPTYYKKFPIETIDGTVFGLKNMLELARKKDVRSFLYFSSSEIYGDPDPNFIPTPETYKGNVSSIGVRACYDESKRLGETLCIAYHQVHKTPVKIVRPFNVYGPGMSSKDYRVVPMFLCQGLKGMPLTVHDQGNQTRTFCYASDAISGFFKVLLSGKDGEVYNIGNDGDEINMRALAELIARDIFDKKIDVNLIPYPETYPQDEPRRRCPDLKKAKQDLGHELRVNLTTGLKRTHLWLKIHEKLT